MSDSEKPKSSWRERRQTIKHKWLAPFIFPEWLCERLSYLLGRWAFLEILGYAGRLTILVAVIFYFFEADERRLQSTSLRMQVENLGLQLENQRKAKHYQAWQVIHAAQGKPGSGGRRDALQDLHREGISLGGVDISKAHLPKLNLEKADLTNANLTGANLWAANLTRAFLYDANLAGAFLYDANLSEAYLGGSNLTNIKNWKEIKRIEEAYIFGVKNPPEGFIEWATEHGAVSIDDIEKWEKLLSEKRQEKTKEK